MRLVLSGPAGGVIGAAFVARLPAFPNVITYDMGGTSTDVATIIDGRPRWTTATQIDGLPIGVPMFDIHTIGAGGGSIAYSMPAARCASARNRAGALPGPACYGRGGTLPTVTDANIVLGRLPRDGFLMAQMKLDIDRGTRAVESLRNCDRSLDHRDRVGHRARGRIEHDTGDPRGHRRRVDTTRAISRWSASAGPVVCTRAPWPNNSRSRA